MTRWTDFLAEHGARFDHETVLSFGAPGTELEAARDRAVVCDLAPLGVLRVAGPDAAAFLQGQLTNDVVALAAGSSQIAAWCSPKGRMLANFLVRRIDDNAFELIFSRTLLEVVRRRLPMFVLRAKLTIEDATAASVRLGIGGPAAATAIGDAFGAVPALHRWTVGAGGATAALPGARFIAIVDPQRAAPLWQTMASLARAAGYPAWEWLTIRAGVPVITAATSDQLVPQTANLDALGGVNFHKGCYTGQEIVARTQYLGRLKERLVLAHVDGASPVPADRLYCASVFGDQACGTIVNAASAPGGGCDLLAVLQNAARESGDVRLAAPDGRRLALLPLPYPLPAAAPPRIRIT